MSGGVPTTTSSTTTVNQSPWQNPTYQALMLGTTNNPGPVTSILRHNAATMGAYDRLLSQGVTPRQIMNDPTYNPSVLGAGQTFQPTQKAAEGGPMEAQGFAAGGSPKALTSAQVAAVNKFNNIIASGGQPSAALTAQLNKIETKSGRNVSPYVDTGTAAVSNTKLQNSIAKAQQSGNYPAGTGTSPYASISTTYPGSAAVKSTTTAKTTEDLLKSSLGQTAGIRVNDQGQFESTNPLFNQAVSEVQAAQTLPGQFGQATDAYNQAIAGLQGLATYAPQMITPERIAGTRYDATTMQAPEDITAQGYTAAQMQGAQMRGPQQWSNRAAQQYMDPYERQVLNAQLQIQDQQNAIQNAALRSQAAGQKAYGGARSQLALGQQQFNQNLANQNLVAQGLSNAYNTALGQFNTAQGQKLQAGQANLSAAMATQQANQAAQNQAMQNYVNNALAAATTSYGGKLTAAQQNQIAQNAAAQFNAQQAQNANLANQQAALTAAQANQSAGLQGNQQNIGAWGQAAGAAQGLGALGAQQASTNLANIGAMGQAASAWQNLQQQYLNTQAQNATNTLNLPTSQQSGVANMINAQPSSGGTSATVGTAAPANPFVTRAEGGEVKAHKAWDEAKKGKIEKKGIASKGWN